MKPTIFLLFFITVNVIVGARSKEVVFPPKVLEADLDAIEKYYKKGDDTLTAYIHWPNSITFKVKNMMESSGSLYLKINGKFQYKQGRTIHLSYEGLYYRNSKFYVKKSDSEPMQPILPDMDINYVNTFITELKPYVSIRYFGFKELTEEIKAHIKRNTKYFKSLKREPPTTCLVTMQNPDGHFFEFVFLGKDQNPEKTEGLVRLLIGKKETVFSDLKLADNVLGSQLLFNQKNFAVTEPSNEDKSVDLRNVLGIRLTGDGFLAVVGRSDVKLYSTQELNSDSLLRNRGSSLTADRSLLQKVQAVNLWPVYIKDTECPKPIKFQVHGMVLVKTANCDADNKLKDDCPFEITFENLFGFFVNVENEPNPVPTLCAGYDDKFWVI